MFKRDILYILIADYKDKIRGFGFLMLTVTSIFIELFFKFENISFILSNFQFSFNFNFPDTCNNAIFTLTYGLSIFFPIFIFIFIATSLHKDFEEGMINLIFISTTNDKKYIYGKILSSIYLSLTALLITWLVSFVVLNLTYNDLAYYTFFLSFIKLIPITILSCILSIMLFQFRFSHKIYGLILFIFITILLKFTTYFCYHNTNINSFIINLLIIVLSIILMHIYINKNTFNKDKILYEIMTLKENKFITICNTKLNVIKDNAFFKIKNTNNSFITLLDMELKISVFRKNYKWYLGLLPIMFLIILLPLKIVETYIIYLAILYLINEISYIGDINSKYAPLKSIGYLPNMLNRKLLASYLCGFLMILTVGIPFIIRLFLASEYMAIYAYLATAFLLPSISLVLSKITNNVKVIQLNFAFIWTISLTHIGFLEYSNLSFSITTILKYSLYILISIIAVYISYNLKERTN